VLDRFAIDASVALAYWFGRRRGVDLRIERALLRLLSPRPRVSVLLLADAKTLHSRRADEYTLEAFHLLRGLHAGAGRWPSLLMPTARSTRWPATWRQRFGRGCRELDLPLAAVDECADDRSPIWLSPAWLEHLNTHRDEPSLVRSGHIVGIDPVLQEAGLPEDDAARFLAVVMSDTKFESGLALPSVRALAGTAGGVPGGMVRAACAVYLLGIRLMQALSLRWLRRRELTRPREAPARARRLLIDRFMTMSSSRPPGSSSRRQLPRCRSGLLG
jgi:hypothetical protein